MHTPYGRILEGQFRPGHFSGVLTIVMKLFLLAKANKVYFGEKDYQQYELIRSLVKNYFIDTEIIGCETIRESSGLACSSRNKRLSAEERKIADNFANRFLNHSSENLEDLKNALSTLNLTVEYLEIYQGRLFVAVQNWADSFN